MFKNIYRSGSNILTRTIINPVSKDSLQTHNLNFFLLANKLIGKSLVYNNTLTTHQTSNSTPSYLPATTFTRSMASGGVESSAKSHKYTNRLAQEKSPYLLQHAHNPVNWYPWGEEAIEKARRENKLIFLSVGYSTCHWCHVMERESFENEQVAELMNQHFINIKVDREERPDIDRIYMQFVLMMLGSGGWPMSVWLTPDLAPITAGTYFPPQDRWGTPAFSTVLEVIANKWATKPNEMKLTGLKVIQVLKKALKEKSSETAPHEADSCERQLLQLEHILRQRFDREYGGFGSHPKFPEVSRLNLLLHSYAVTKADNILNMALHTLDCIGRGGIHDHVFGGFARYTVDRQWHVPHFEKMLYDQGQLMVAYSNAYKLTRNTEYLNYANGIFRYITTDLQHPLGGFYAGEDADSLPHAGDTTKIEGAFYAWSYNEVKQLIVTNKGNFMEFEKDVGDINKIFEIYSHHYDVKLDGNVLPSSDPHGHLVNKNILIVLGSLQTTCEKFGVQKEQLEKILIIINDLLYNARRQRPRPHLDTKIICAWNGLVLSGISKLANSDSSQRGVYLKAAEKLKQFIYDNLYDRESQKLKRACYGVTTNEATLLQNAQSEEINGFLDDYAFLIRGLLDYYEATCDESSLQWAKDLQDIQNSLFWDNEQFGYYYSQADCPNVVMRFKDEQDGAEPCGNSVTARNLIMLSYYYEEDSYSIKLKQLFEYYADQKPLGIILPEMLSALLLHDNDFDVVAVLDPQHELSEHILMLCRQYFIPGLILQWQRADEPFKGGNKTKHMVNGQPSVYICHQHVCQLPITDPVELTERLDEYFLRKSSAGEKKPH